MSPTSSIYTMRHNHHILLALFTLGCSTPTTFRPTQKPAAIVPIPQQFDATASVALEISPDGRSAVSVTQDNLAIINLDTGVIERIVDLPFRVIGADMSADGLLLALNHVDGIEIIDMDGVVIMSLADIKPLHSPSFSSAGDKVATVTSTGVLVLSIHDGEFWTNNFNEQLSDEDKYVYVTSVDFAHDGKVLVGTNSCIIFSFNPDEAQSPKIVYSRMCGTISQIKATTTGDIAFIADGNLGMLAPFGSIPYLDNWLESDTYINNIQFSSNDAFLYAIAEGKIIRFAMDRNDPVGQQVASETNLSALAVFPDGETLLLAGGHGLDVVSGAATSHLAGRPVPVFAIHTASANSTIVVTAGQDDAHVWDITAGALRTHIHGLESTDHFASLALDASAARVAIGGIDDASRELVVQVWDTATGEIHRDLRHGQLGLYLNDLIFTPDGETLLYATAYRVFAIGVTSPNLDFYYQFDALIDGLAYAGNSTVAVASGDYLFLLDMKDGDVVSKFSTDDSWQFAANGQGQIAWQATLRNEETSQTFITIADSITGSIIEKQHLLAAAPYLEFMGNNSLVAASSNSVSIIGVGSNPMADVTIHPRSLHSIALHPTEQTLAIGSRDDNAIHLFNRLNGQRIDSVNSDGCEAMEFSSNGGALLCGTRDSLRMVSIDEVGKFGNQVTLYGQVSDEGLGSLAIASNSQYSMVGMGVPLAFRVGDHILDTTQLSAALHRPSLMEDFWSGHPIALPKSTSEGMWAPPSLTFLELPARSERRTLEVRLRVAARGGGLSGLELHLGRKPLVFRRLSEVRDGMGNIVMEYTASLRLAKGCNVLRAEVKDASRMAMETRVAQILYGDGEGC